MQVDTGQNYSLNVWSSTGKMGLWTSILDSARVQRSMIGPGRFGSQIVNRPICTPSQQTSCLIYSRSFCHTPRICNLILLLISVILFRRNCIGFIYFLIFAANINGFACRCAIALSSHCDSVIEFSAKYTTWRSTTKLNYILYGWGGGQDTQE